MEKYQGSVIVIKYGRVVENISFKTNIEAERIFLDKCEQYISNFDLYTTKDIETILYNQVEHFGTGFITIVWFNV